MKTIAKMKSTFCFVFCMLMGSLVTNSFGDTSYYHSLKVVSSSLAKTILGGVSGPGTVCLAIPSSPCVSVLVDPCTNVDCDNVETVNVTLPGGLIDQFGKCTASPALWVCSDLTALNNNCTTYDASPQDNCTKSADYTNCGFHNEAHCTVPRWVTDGSFNDGYYSCDSSTCTPRVNAAKKCGVGCDWFLQ